MANQWTDKQKEAIYLNGQNILVSAAAGSGKNGCFSAEILEKITSKENPIDARQTCYCYVYKSGCR